jgi:hypothetical protein
MKDLKDLTDFKFKEERLSVASLQVDPRVQRPLNPRRVEAMLATYNPAGLGVISVSRRNAVTDVIIDGQHRREVILRANDGGGEALCHVYEGLTLAEEAKLFLLLNNASKPTLIAKHLVGVTAGDPLAVEIERLVKEYGWAVSEQAGPATITAIGSLQKIVRFSERVEADPHLLSMALLAVTRAWGTQHAGVRGVILEGIAAIFHEYKDRVDLDRLVNKMKGFEDGPQGLHDRAQFYSKQEKITMPMAVARLLVAQYNVGAKSKALETWRRRR